MSKRPTTSDGGKPKKTRVNFKHVNDVVKELFRKIEFNPESSRGSESSTSSMKPTSSLWQCTLCDDRIIGDSWHFKRHLCRYHPLKAEELQLDVAKLSWSATKDVQNVRLKKKEKELNQMLLNLVKLFVKNSLPFRLFEDESFHRLVLPQFQKLGVIMNRNKLRELVIFAAGEVTKNLTNELDNKFLSLEIDSAKKHNTNLFSIKCRYVVNDTVVTRSLGDIVIYGRQTGEKLCFEIEKCLQRFNKTAAHVYSLTSDHGSNMAAASKLSKQAQLTSCLIPTSDSDCELEAIDSDSETEEIEQGLSGDAAFTGAATVEPFHLPGAMMSSIFCGAHTANLAANDVTVRDLPIDDQVSKIRLFVKECKNVRHHERFVPKTMLKKPRLDVNIRWLSTFLMLKDLHDNEENFKEIMVFFGHKLTRVDWQFISNYVNAFSPLYDAMLIFQRADLSVGK